MESVKEFCAKWGDVASLLGLFISVAGFVITLVGFGFTLRGQRKIRQTVREAVRRVALQLAAAEADKMLRLLTGAREDAGRYDWPRVIDRCHEAMLVIWPLVNNPVLSDEERAALRKAEDDLRLMVQYVRRKARAAASPQQPLSGQKSRILDKLVATLGRIKGRLQNTALEV